MSWESAILVVTVAASSAPSYDHIAVVYGQCRNQALLLRPWIAACICRARLSAGSWTPGTTTDVRADLEACGGAELLSGGEGNGYYPKDLEGRG